jgi:hypothetical protein
MEEEKNLWKYLKSEKELTIKRIIEQRASLLKSEKILKTIQIRQTYLLEDKIPKFCEYCGSGIIHDKECTLCDCMKQL